MEAIIAGTQAETVALKKPVVDEQVARDAVRTLLMAIGEDPDREGLLDTPKRVVKALREMTAGYSQSASSILSTVFEERYQGIVILKGIRFTSTCEHHLLPFVGVADVAYIPNMAYPKVVGLSKLARLVECFAKRLQVQERMTQEITSAIVSSLNATAAATVLRAHHSCMGCRGVRQSDAEMVTSCLEGLFKINADARAELMQLLNHGSR